MFVNNLFADFLIENGLQIDDDGATRDLICLEFNYGSRSYEDEMAHLRKIGRNARTEYKLAKSLGHQVQIDKKRNKRKKIAEIYRTAIKNAEKYNKKSKEQIRSIYYQNGCDIRYRFISKNRKPMEEIIHYKMLYRSTGKAKKGSCMFIREELYDMARNFLYMGIELPKENAPIVEISAYASLISSGIVGRIEIDPHDILILKDVDRTFVTDVIDIRTNQERQCVAAKVENYEVTNTLFDGQALIDSSIFPPDANGYILLRHHFCKMASFSANIQEFFKDYFKENYNTASVCDMFGNSHLVKDIKLITTDNAMKWLKFDVSYETWCEKVGQNGNKFGIVKTAHKSKLGSVQRMSYQMVNSLDMAIMENVAAESVAYVERLKSDDDFFLDYLRQNQNFSNDYEAILALCEQNREFVRSEYYRNRKRKIIEAYVLNMKSGRILQNAENLTIVGSPYAMLLYAATGDPNAVDSDMTFSVEQDTIQCYTERFDNGEYLAAFRSPFNSRNNLTYLHNVYSNNMRRYFNLGKQVIAVNLNGTDFQCRNNGSDQDSDSCYVTDQQDIVAFAQRCYKEYPTIVNNIPKEKNIYSNNMSSYAKLDNNLAKSQLDIGESSNLAQIAQTYMYNFDGEEYNNYACILAVLAQVSIDSAKRRFDINIGSEITRIKREMDVKQYGYPRFWSIIRKDFDKNRINFNLQCPMNYLYDLELTHYRSEGNTLPMSVYFMSYTNNSRKKSQKVEKMIEKYSLELYRNHIDVDNDDNVSFLLRNDFEDLVREIRNVTPSGNYLGLYSWLLNRGMCIEPSVKQNSKKIKTTLNKNQALLVRTLYMTNKGAFLKCFAKC